jgi:[CysO sulfur-carrier protein]-S-L-cysteine hydrolase
MTKIANAQVTISIEAEQALFADIYQRPTIEACGVLLGTIDEQGNWHVEQIYPLRNIFSSPVYFEFDPEELLMVELSYPGQIVGAYHSHPTGFPRASSTDRENMRRVNQEQQIPWVWLIVSGPFEQDQRADERVTSAPMIAYHHYMQDGLHKVSIQLEDTK